MLVVGRFGFLQRLPLIRAKHPVGDFLQLLPLSRSDPLPVDHFLNDADRPRVRDVHAQRGQRRLPCALDPGLEVNKRLVIDVIAEQHDLGLAALYDVGQIIKEVSGLLLQELFFFFAPDGSKDAGQPGPVRFVAAQAVFDIGVDKGASGHEQDVHVRQFLAAGLRLIRPRRQFSAELAQEGQQVFRR